MNELHFGVSSSTGSGVDSPQDDDEDEGNDESCEESATIVALATFTLTLTRRVGGVVLVTILALSSAEEWRMDGNKDKPVGIVYRIAQYQF